MTKYIAVACICLLASLFSNCTAAAAIIPADRSTDWSQAGVAGGIPSANWQTCKTLSPSGGDDTSAIQSALNQCGSSTFTPGQGKIVLLNAGTYNFKIASSITTNNVVLRGAGPDKTILKITPAGSGNGNIVLGNSNDWPPFSQSTIMNIVGGATKGSTSITVQSGASTSMAGNLMHISQANGQISSNTEPVITMTVTGTSSTGSNPTADRDRNNQRNMQQMVRITGVSGNTITFIPALYFSYTNNPQAAVLKSTSHQLGIEDLKMDNSAASSTSNSAYSAIMLWFCDQCWIKNVEASHIRNGFFLYGTLNCEIRDSYFHHPVANQFADGSDNGYNQVSISSSTLIENNIFTNLLAPIILQGASGNVISYNYYTNIRAGDITNIISSINLNHGGHSLFNLVEGNVANLVQPDNYYGSSSHGLIFRNYFTGTDTGVTQRRKPISIDAKSVYYTIVGNILGTTSLSNWQYEANGGSVPNPVVYRLGYQGIGNDGINGWDSQVKQTLLRGGNYDQEHKQVIWQANAPDSPTTYLPQQTIPASIYLSSKPSWFGSVAWPPIGPDVSGYTNKIPAQLRFEGTSIPMVTCQQDGGTCCSSGQACSGTTKAASDCAACCAATCQSQQTCIAGDLNCDKKVDIFDLVIVAQNYGKTTGFDARADANKDGKINIFDLVIVAQNYGKTG